MTKAHVCKQLAQRIKGILKKFIPLWYMGNGEYNYCISGELCGLGACLLCL